MSTGAFIQRVVFKKISLFSENKTSVVRAIAPILTEPILYLGLGELVSTRPRPVFEVPPVTRHRRKMRLKNKQSLSLGAEELNESLGPEGKLCSKRDDKSLITSAPCFQPHIAVLSEIPVGHKRKRQKEMEKRQELGSLSSLQRWTQRIAERLRKMKLGLETSASTPEEPNASVVNNAERPQAVDKPTTFNNQSLTAESDTCPNLKNL